MPILMVLLAVLASASMLLLGSASEPDRQVVDTVHSSDLFSPQGIMNATQRPNMQNGGGKYFELPITPGEQTSRAHYLGFCGSLSKDVWKGGRWIALTVLANIALGLVEEFPQFAEQRKQCPVRWLLTAGTDPAAEVRHAVRLLQDNVGELPRPQPASPADILIGCGSADTTEAVAGEAAAAHTPLISPTPFIGSGDTFPYFIRTGPSESDTVKGFLEICKHFGWNRVGLLYQQPKLWPIVQNLRNKDIQYPLIDPFFFADDDVIAKVSESYLRVLGLATPHSPVATKILRTAADLGLKIGRAHV